MIRNLWFQLHWFAGVTAGVVLAVIGVTGALLSFEHDILRLINPNVLTVTPANGRLAPEELLARVQKALPERRINMLALHADPHDAAVVHLASTNTANRRGETRHVHPYTGELLGEVRGERFFQVTMRLHRWLMFDDLFENRQLGKQVVGASTILLIMLTLSGLYLRWPRQAKNWRVWLTFNLGRKGRGFIWDMHAVLGTWALLFYLLASLTGLYWSYDWYRGFLHKVSGVPMMQRSVSATQVQGVRTADIKPAATPFLLPPAQEIRTAFALFEREAPGYSRVMLRLPQDASGQWSATYLDTYPPHERATNRMRIDVANGQVTEHDRYADRPINARLMSSILPLHSGSYFGTAGLLLMMIASLLMPLFTITGWMLYLERRQNKKARRAARCMAEKSATDSGSPWLIAHASQSGTAERLAWQSAVALQQAGMAVQVKSLGQLCSADLAGYSRALFVASTFGEGEAPVAARPFLREMRMLNLSGLSYGLLALGDRQYSRFCAFAHALERWLLDNGAQPLFRRVDVDNGAVEALESWRQRLAGIGGVVSADVWQETPFQSWRLRHREILNPGSNGLPVYHLELEGPEGCSWQAGDRVEVAVGTMAAQARQPCCVRQYSIASIPSDGRLHLLVRQVILPDGELGQGSGWLTDRVPMDGEVALRIRAHEAFYAPQNDELMILIGNGTGIAGLRALLRERLQRGQRGNWLLFGERHEAHDFHYRDEIQHWWKQGDLRQLDTVFSRDQQERRYIQQCLQEQATMLRAWLDNGAMIYVCGSVVMGQGIEQVLAELVGNQALEEMIAAGRYRSDVY